MKTYVTYSDYKAIKDCMTEEEIKEKYGRLIVIKEEHKDYLKKIKKKGDVYENNSISKQHH